MTLLVLVLLCTAASPALADTTKNKSSWVGSSTADSTPQNTTPFPKGFIKVYNTGFVDEQCREFVPVGWNAWNDPMLIQAMVAANGTEWGAKYIEDTFQAARAMGFNTMRIFGFGIDKVFTLQTAPGEYNETVWRGFDYVLDVASRYNIRVIWAMTTQWNELADGVHSYINWAGIEPDTFWVDERAQQMFKDHMSVVVNRVNTVNNRWNLYNEMRCPTNQTSSSMKEFCRASINTWVRDMAQYLKDEDPYHLVTVGNEGFFDFSSTYKQYNPSGVPDNVYPGWAAFVGQDFVSNHAHPNIDFAAFHMWPDNWKTENLTWVEMWITAHVDAAKELGKPVVLEEYGKRTFPGMSESQRDPFFNLVHSLVQTSIRADNYLKGSIVWFWDPFYFYHNDGVSKTPGQSLPPTAAVVQPNDTTYALLKTHAAEIEGTTGTWRGQACDAHLLGEVYPLYQGPRGGLQEPAAAPGVVQVAG